MQTIELTHPHAFHAADIPETVAAIGFFDGIHKGHQTVIKHAVKEARERHMESAVITFHPHPSVVFSANVQQVEYITPLPEKKRFLESLLVDRLYIITFNKQLSLLEPQTFIDHYIIGLHIKHVVAGFDFTYGPKDKANMETIEKHTRGLFTYTTVEKVESNGGKVSSTAIRKCLREGEIKEANQLLGRPFTVSGEVSKGDQRGRELGYPTANIAVRSDALLPREGVYAVKVPYNGKVYNGMVNLGTNPTFTPTSQALSLEVHLLDFKQNIYGSFLTIEWYQHIRPEEEFLDAKSLIDQMKQDEEVIRSYFSS